MSYSVENSGGVTLREYADVFGDVVMRGLREKHRSTHAQAQVVRGKTLWSINMLLVNLHLFSYELSGN